MVGAPRKGVSKGGNQGGGGAARALPLPRVGLGGRGHSYSLAPRREKPERVADQDICALYWVKSYASGIKGAWVRMSPACPRRASSLVSQVPDEPEIPFGWWTGLVLLFVHEGRNELNHFCLLAAGQFGYFFKQSPQLALRPASLV